MVATAPPESIERVEVLLGAEDARLPHARLRHVARDVFGPGGARFAPDWDPQRLLLEFPDEALSHLSPALRDGVKEMVRRLRDARDGGAPLPSITFRLLAAGGMLVEELPA